MPSPSSPMATRSMTSTALVFAPTFFWEVKVLILMTLAPASRLLSVTSPMALLKSWPDDRSESMAVSAFTTGTSPVGGAWTPLETMRIRQLLSPRHGGQRGLWDGKTQRPARSVRHAERALCSRDWCAGRGVGPSRLARAARGQPRAYSPIIVNSYA